MPKSFIVNGICIHNNLGCPCNIIPLDPKCDDLNTCTTDTCLENFSCQHFILPDTTPCSEDICYTGESCVGGICGGGNFINTVPLPLICEEGYEDRPMGGSSRNLALGFFNFINVIEVISIIIICYFYIVYKGKKHNKYKKSDSRKKGGIRKKFRMVFRK